MLTGSINISIKFCWPSKHTDSCISGLKMHDRKTQPPVKKEKEKSGQTDERNR